MTLHAVGPLTMTLELAEKNELTQEKAVGATKLALIKVSGKCFNEYLP